MPEVSFIIPVYNREAIISQSAMSCLDQNYRDIEVIAVDDGSSDGTLEVLEAIQKKDARLKIITQSNAGVSAARNRGLQEAKGKYVSFLDSDDIMMPQATDYALNFMAQNRLNIFNGANGGFFEGDNVGLEQTYQYMKEKAQRIFKNHVESGHREDNYLAYLSKNKSVGSFNGIFLLKHFCDEVGGFDSELRAAEECEFMWRLGLHFPKEALWVGYRPLVVLKRIGHPSLSMDAREKKPVRPWALLSTLKILKSMKRYSYMDTVKIEDIGHKLFRMAVIAHRNGYTEDAREALKFWEQLELPREKIEPCWMNLLYAVFGVDASERLYAILRRIKRS